MKQHMKFTFSLLALLSISSHADDLDYGVAKARWFFYGDLDSKNNQGELEMQQWRLQTPIRKPWKLVDDLFIMPSIRYELIDLDSASFVANPFEEELHMLELPLLFAYQPDQSPWSYNARISPGISSDLQSITTDDLFCDARLGAGYQINSRFNINFGISYTRAIGEPQVFPYLGFVYQMSDQWQIAWRGFSFEARCQLTEDWIFRLTSEATGGYWNVESTDAESISLQSYRAGFTIERELREDLWVVAGAGYTLGNELNWISDAGRTVRREEFDNGCYLTLGLRLRDW